MLRERGDEVVGLVREGSTADVPVRHWSPTTGDLEAPVVSGFDAVVHLTEFFVIDVIRFTNIA